MSVSGKPLPTPSFAIATFSGQKNTWIHFFGVYTILMNERMMRIILGAIDAGGDDMEGRSIELAETMESILGGKDSIIQDEFEFHRFGRTYQLQTRTEGLVVLKQALDDGSDDGYFIENGHTLRAFHAQIGNLLDNKPPVPSRTPVAEGRLVTNNDFQETRTKIQALLDEYAKGVAITEVAAAGLDAEFGSARGRVLASQGISKIATEEETVEEDVPKGYTESPFKPKPIIG